MFQRMGMLAGDYWLSWFITYALIALVPALITVCMQYVSL